MSLTQERRSHIGEFAGAVRKFMRAENELVFDVDSAVVSLGGKVDVMTPAEQVESVGDANIQKVAPRSFSIRVAESSPERRRFNIAHELGHLFLHMGFADPQRWEAFPMDVVMDRNGAPTQQEYEAHEFAGALLMPSDLFRSVAQEHRSSQSYNVAEIAQRFGVSIPAATTRGRWLGMFSWD